MNNDRSKEYVWYAGYGSNLYPDRFHCYILGGRPPGSDDENPGCSDRSLPIDEVPHQINHDLYFAKSSSKWQGGGMGFIRTDSNPLVTTYCNMYLITKTQFCKVVQQENKLSVLPTFDFESVINNGGIIFRRGGTYGNLLFVGHKNEYPIFTFTNEQNITPVRRPSENYLKMIMTGLIQAHHLSENDLVNYLITKEGIRNNYTHDYLLMIYNSVVSQ